MTTQPVEESGGNTMAVVVVAGKESAPKKVLLEQIMDWSEASLREWQRDGLRRLFVRSSPELTPADYKELYGLLKKSNGVPGADPVVAMPWAREHLPNTAGDSQYAKLNSMRELKFVNKIAAGQVLQFSPEGMTVVYGGNGSGKSGYSRVLKRACRARDQSEPIHPDATDATQAGKVPEACFEIELEGKAKTVAWSLKDPPPEDLATIAVFDGKCARAYLTTEGDVAYMPFGLDVLAGLANKVLPELERMLSAELAGIDVDLSALDGLRGETKVGAQIENFGPKTNEEVFKLLATMGDGELARLKELEKTLAQEDPAATAKKVRLERQRIMELARRIDASCGVITPEAVEKLKRLDGDDVAAAKAVEVAAQQLRSGDTLLAGTGDEVWRMMFEAARKYSIEVAYAGHSFPHTEAGAVCPLCQQDVDDVGERLKRFDAFLKQNSATVAQKARAAVRATVGSLEAANLGFGIDDSLAAELGAIGGGVLEAVKTFEKSVEDRRRTILTSVATHDWAKVGAFAADPRAALQKHAGDLAVRAEEFEKASDPEKKKVLVSECLELKARVALHKNLRKVTTLLANLKTKAALETCRKDLKTTGISTKAKAFAEEAVTAALREALEREFEKLGGVPKTKVADRIDKGKAKYRLQFAGATPVGLEEILSEGEQRAMAIGSFLAELGVAGHKGAIVFDDPVSSLDHQRKRQIAKRLGEEAKVRQVIVFTHDLPFLALLVEEVEAAKAEYVTHWLERDGSGCAGRVKLNDSPAESPKYRSSKLGRASIQKAEKLGGSEAVEMLRHAAGQLRRTIEEVVQEYLFKDVIARWRENLMVTKVKLINWDNAAADEIDSLFAELSRVFEGHSHSGAYAGGVPEVADLLKLADRVDKVIAAAKKPRG